MIRDRIKELRRAPASSLLPPGIGLTPRLTNAG